MAATDISLGYINQFIIDYEGPEGNHGPSYSIGTTNLGYTDNHGPSYSLNTVDLGYSNNHGPSYSFSAAGLLVGLLGFQNAKLIHYNEVSEVHGGIIFGRVTMAPPTGVVLNVGGHGKLVGDIIGDSTLGAHQVNALYTNSAASGLTTTTLPPVVATSGAMIDFVRTSANALRVAASGEDRIVLPTGNAGVVELTSIGTQLKLVSNGITSWLSI